jgi:hypothetical protein
MWKQRPVEEKLETVLTLYTLATDFQRLADEIAALAIDLFQPHRPTLRGAPSLLHALAWRTSGATAAIGSTERCRTPTPLHNVHGDRLAEAIAPAGINVERSSTAE